MARPFPTSSPIIIKISGGEALERAVLVSEIASNLESCDVAVRVTGVQVEHYKGEDHEEHLKAIAEVHEINIINTE